MARRDIYLRIEVLPSYSPLAPILCSRRWGRDCMRNMGHELGRIPADEIFAATVNAVVYRQYHDRHFLQPVTDKLIAVDAAEPPWDRRVPGTVLYAEPGEQLHIHVHNADPDACHSFHLHGLRYALDSDGAWPLGVVARDGRRSDEIRPGESWTYLFEATEATIGAWPFHSHVRQVGQWIDLGLFGGLVVRDPDAPPVDREIPLFLHRMQGAAGAPAFASPALSTGQTFAQPFGTVEQTVPYYCRIHGTTMSGTVLVQAGAPAAATVTIVDNAFQPASVSVAPGGTVTWFNTGHHQHLVFSGGGGVPTYCLNGRAYVGNTPIVEVEPGERLRWYLFNLDVGEAWHNFHPHAMRWQLPAPPGGAGDVHALSPVETFVIDTEAPAVLHLPSEEYEKEDEEERDEEHACRVCLRGDFLFHCHVEDHMMGGLAGVVRSRQTVALTEEGLERTGLVLPFDGDDVCAAVDGRRTCGSTMAQATAAPEPNVPFPTPAQRAHPARKPAAPAPGMAEMPGMAGMPSLGGVVTPTQAGPVATAMPGMQPMPGMGGMAPTPSTDPLQTAANIGAWELLACDSHTLAVHAVLLHGGRVLLFSGSGNFPPRHTGHQYGSALWNPDTGSFTTPPIAHDVFCAGQVILPSGDVLAAGGTKNYDNPWQGLPDASVFSAATEAWADVAPMADGRWYPTLVATGDGHVLIFSGLNQTSGALNDSIEHYNPDTDVWQTLGLHTPGWPLYPHLFLLGDGRLISTGGSLSGGGPGPQLVDVAAGVLTPVPGLRDLGLRGQCASVLLPPAQDQRVMVISGGGGNPFVTTTAVDIADFSGPAPLFSPAAPIHHGRTHLNAVLLPDRTVFVSGGGSGAESQPVLTSEIYDPLTDTWTLGPDARVGRLYHSVALLLPSGEVLTAGSNPDRGDDELRMEIYHPPYLFRGPRPVIDRAPGRLHHGAHFTIRTPQAKDIRWAQLIRPMATTHSCDTEQRVVDLPFEVRGMCEIHTELPANPNLVPPGWYMLTLVSNEAIPSVARWVHVEAQPHAMA